ncbi:hypothetical protein S7711_09225 [Stachybotrys chartarum IBT 7711]|uniref:Thioredoxin-like fold domain-containing protein n=1 Tax=Stachybotrys chartarum (strain CBS 109288 / IBT 7711) TaxID=1280523 RepID=A0A084ALN3_STACB|nr:hypothetical protein S7711_09225 [Stachybotrys chartarum IBT 7711]
MTNSEIESLILYRGFPPDGTYTWSPFVNKLEARLRFEGVRYKAGAGSPRDAPRGKIPYLTVQRSASAPQSLGDTELIIRALVGEGILTDLNSKLSAVERAHSLGLKAVLEDRVYFYTVREKWVDNYYAMRAGVLASVPWPMQIPVGVLVYRSVTTMLHGQGTGRLSAEEVETLNEEAWESINAIISEARTRSSGAVQSREPFWVLGGEQPTELDATIYGFITSSLVCDAAAPVTKRAVESHSALVDYAERIHDRFFPDYKKWN